MTVQQALAALGDTAAQVAATLRAAGIKGHRGSPGCCPVAVYLQGKGFPGASVGCVVCDAGEWLGLVGLPRAVWEFVAAFDRGRYPDLEAP